jgi:alkylation response protein AidB-like acyl-CoA dehydrogenase
VDRYGERAGALVSHESQPTERRQMVLAVRQVVEKEILPVAQAHEQSGRAAAVALPHLADLGLLAAPLSADDGGLALPPEACAALLEELARGWASLAVVVASHLVGIRTLASRAGASTAGAFGRGERLAATSLAGDVRLRRDGATVLLDGTTGLVEGVASAHVLVVGATGPDHRRVLVEVPLPTRGVRVGAPEPVLGLKAAGAARVTFEDVRLEPQALLDNSAFDQAVAFAHLTAGAIAVGLAQAAFEAALRYAQQRSAFGKPISQHQAIQLKLADMATGVSAARLLVADAGADPVRAAVAKLQASATALNVTLESMRTHGGYGYTAEFPVERYYRDAARLLHMPIPEDEARAAAAQGLLTGGAPGAPHAPHASGRT